MSDAFLEDVVASKKPSDIRAAEKLSNINNPTNIPLSHTYTYTHTRLPAFVTFESR